MRFRNPILWMAIVTLAGWPSMTIGQPPATKTESKPPTGMAVVGTPPSSEIPVWGYQLATPSDSKLLTWSRFLSADLAAVDPPLQAQLKLNDGEGYVVTGIKTDGAGAESGLVIYDVVVGLSDEPKQDAAYPIQVWRRGDRQLLTVKGKPEREGWIGVNLHEIDDAMRSQLSLPAGRGLLVQEVTDGSPAEQAGLQKFDVIDGWSAGTPSGTVEEFSKIIRDSEGKSLGVQILRHGKSMTIHLTPLKRPAEPATTEVIGSRLLWLSAVNANPELAARRSAITLNHLVTNADLTQGRWRLLGHETGRDRQAQLGAVERQLDQLLKEVQAARQAIDELRKLEDRAKEKPTEGKK